MSVILDFHDIVQLPNQSLSVIQCGLTICHPGHKSLPLIYNHYSAHFILEGKGTYIVNEKTYELGPGEGFLITPSIRNVYIADKVTPWKYIYATFDGIDADSFIHQAGLDNENVTFAFNLDNSMKHDLYAMYEASKNYDAKGYDVSGYFLLVMSRLIKQANRHAYTFQATEDYVKRALSYIEANYPYNISIQDIASYVGIARSYLYKLFMKHFQISPSNYLSKYRLSMATKFLEEFDIPISEIALASGFHDVSHFYRVFTQQYHMSPKNYKLMKQGE